MVRVDRERAGEDLTWLVDPVSGDGSRHCLPGEDRTSRIGLRDELPGDEWVGANPEEVGPAGCQV